MPHDEPMQQAGGLPAALSAFLRGVERRAYVFLWLQDGDPGAAERALAAAIRAFPGPAGQMPMAEWPDRFWRLLVALPAGDGGGQWPAGLEALAAIGLPARRALLLRQVAGLDEAAAAAVLGVERPAYEALLAQACPRTPAGAPDPVGWRTQAEAIQHAGRGLEAAQLLQLARLREAALAARPALATTAQAPARAAAAARAARPAPGTAAGAGPWRRWLPALLAIVLVAGAVAATWWWSSRPATPAAVAGDPAAAAADDFRVHDNPPVQIEALPPADPRPPAGDPWPAPLPEAAPVDPVVAELALLSWYAAGAPASAFDNADTAMQAVHAAPVAAAPVAAAANADWMQLDASEQASVRQAAAALAAQAPQEQAALRARFAALDAMERGGWRLGPALGADYPRLQPLIGFVDGEERAPLLAALRALSAEQRALLGELALRTPPTARAALRHELLAQPPEQRGAWLAEREQR